MGHQALKCPNVKAGKIDLIKNDAPKDSGKMEWRAKSSIGEGKIVEETVKEVIAGPPPVFQAEKPGTLVAFQSSCSNRDQTSMKDCPEGYEPFISKIKPQEDRLAFPPSNNAQDPNYN
jgi:hypothetical protein